MRKYLSSLILPLLLVLGDATCLQAQYYSSPYARTIGTFVHYYTANMPDNIYDLFNDKMRHNLDEDTWRRAFTDIRQHVGVPLRFSLADSGRQYVNFKAPDRSDSNELIVSVDSLYQIQGIFITPVKAAKKTAPSNFTVNTPDGTITGTLTLPPQSTGQKVPVVLVIAGSGSTDRDGNSPGQVDANSYKLLSEELEKQGIATLRYDKRFVGESATLNKNKDKVTFEDIVKDAQACARKLKADPRFSSVTVLGHSEGSLIGMLVAEREKVNKYISLAGPGERASELLKRQLAQDFPQSTGPIFRLLDSLKDGRTVSSHISARLDPLFDSRNQPYLISWFQYDPAHEIGKLSIPVLIVQGLTDLQVRRQDAISLKAAAPNASLILIDAMNHVLKDAPANREQNLATYKNQGLPVDQQLIASIAQFVGRPD
jgi:pimeloyl-ACP methyl ester carboxylesterase